MPAIRFGALMLAAPVALAACGGDAGSAPDPVDLSGTWYGTSTYSAATCDGALPPGIGTEPFGFPRLFQVTQAGSHVSAADVTDTLHYVGTFDAASGGLAARFQAGLDGADHVDVTDTVTATVSGTPLHLSASGKRTDAIEGQEAPVAIVSLCASTLDEAPRAAGFLLGPNRLNVAVSRAKALAIVVGSRELLETRCRSVEEMRLVNVLCHLVQYAQGIA